MEKVTLKIALKRRAIDDMDTLELRALAYLCKRLFKDLDFPWKRITLMDIPMEGAEEIGGPTMKITRRVPGMRFGSLFIHQQKNDPTRYVVSHYATGRLISEADRLQEAIYLCGALEFGGVPWDLVEDLAGWERIRALPIVAHGLAKIRRAFLLAAANEPTPHDHTPLQRLHALQEQADVLWAVLAISQPGAILLYAGIDGGDTTIIVTADGFGAATYEEFDDYASGPNNRQQMEHQVFATEAEALGYARSRIEDAEEGVPIGEAFGVSDGQALVIAEYAVPV